MVLMTPDLKKFTVTLQFNTTQLSPFCFWVTRTTGNPVYAYRAPGFCKGMESVTLSKMNRDILLAIVFYFD